MLESIFVITIVTIVALIIGRSFYQTMTGKNVVCGCSDHCVSCACRDFEKMDQGQDKNQ